MSLPPTSPRLPSPPPPAEIQIGPPSPSMGANANRQAQQMEQTAIDANARRRIHPGTKAAKMAAGPPLVPLNELDSAFQLQEHLAALHYHHTASHTRPMTREAATLLATPPAGTDKTLWLYELCRFLTAQCNNLIVGFLFDTPPCSAATCPEMRASEWQFLCAVHDAPKSCCAIDYCCHTLDWAANVVTNAKIFPSRFVVDAHDKNTALKNLVNVFRRLHRIFAHAWFQHRGVFWSVESQSGLYVFFKTVCDAYDLLSAENYKLPPESEGLEPAPVAGADASEKKSQVQPTAIAKRDGNGRAGDGEDFNPAGRTNTRRHIKSSPSTGSAVATVLEADEDESTGATKKVREKLRDMHISAPETVEEEFETADVPVIVEHSLLDQPPIRPSSVIPRSPEPESMRQQKPSRLVEAAPAPTPPPPASIPEPDISTGTEGVTPETEGTAEPVPAKPLTEPVEEEHSTEAREPSEPVEDQEESQGDETILPASESQDDSADTLDKPEDPEETEQATSEVPDAPATESAADETTNELPAQLEHSSSTASEKPEADQEAAEPTAENKSE
ncbi:Mob1/phocein [Thozetella sp. PMI_491]|nr:Mob1/phocein [Thozetella sp. PMI_491]